MSSLPDLLAAAAAEAATAHGFAGRCSANLSALEDTYQLLLDEGILLDDGFVDLDEVKDAFLLIRGLLRHALDA